MGGAAGWTGTLGGIPFLRLGALCPWQGSHGRPHTVPGPCCPKGQSPAREGSVAWGGKEGV